MYIYLDNQLIPEHKAKVSYFDPGFMYGFGLFETMRSYNGKIFKLEEHLMRLFFSAKKINIDIQGKTNLLITEKHYYLRPSVLDLRESALKLDEFKKKVNELLQINSIKDGYIKIIVWKGVNKTHILAFARKYPLYPDKEILYKQGVSAIISKVRQNEYSMLAGIKSLNYLPFQLAYDEAQKKQAFEAILLNTKGNLCEGSRSNIFLVKGGTVFTPSLSSGCLAGITRDFVIQLAEKCNIKVIEKSIKPGFLYKADEVFLTNSIMGIMPVVKINKHKINGGKLGEKCLALNNMYKKSIIG